MPDENAPERLRLFIAVEVPETVKALIAKSQADLRDHVPSAAIKWTTQEQFHITLQFLGHLGSRLLPDLHHALDTTCKSFSPFELAARGVGFFPNARRPRVLWIGTHNPQNRLCELARAVQAQTLPFTGEPEERDFSGHITLGRVKEIRRPEIESLARKAAGFTKAEYGCWTISEVLLMRSQLSSTGPTYTCEQRFLLSRSANSRST